MSITETIDAITEPTPSRNQNQAAFTANANAFFSSLPTFQTQINTWAGQANALTVTVNGYLVSSEAARDTALAAQTAAELAETNAETAETGAVAAEAGAVAAAAAAQAAAGLPAISGKTANVLTVIGEPGSETVSFEPGVLGTTLTKSFTSSEEYIIKLSQPATYAPIVTVTKEVPQTGVSNNEWETAVAESEFTLETGLQIGASGIEVDLTGGTYVGQYLVAVTSDAGQIDTDYWTDINSMAPNDAANGEFISYALSDDGRATFFVALNGEGTRDVVRDNAGTWEFNSATDYASTTWTAAAENSLQGALDEAMGVFVGYDVSGASYDSVSFSVAGQDTTPYAFTFNSDGTKMYVIGDSSNTVYQYSLSTGFDMSTASYDSVSFSVAAQDTAVADVDFNSDGTKMYVLGIGNDTVYQYSLSPGFDLSTASYDSVSFSVTTQDSSPFGLAFSNDGSKMYMLGNSNDRVYQYTLSTPDDLSTASYDSVSFLVSGQETTPFGITFNNDGTKMYIIGTTGDAVFQYSLSTGFDLSTAAYDSISFSVSAQDSSPTDVKFNSDGTKMYVIGVTGDSVYQYSITPTMLNTMNSAQLTAVGDAEFPAVTTTLDLAIVLRTDSGGTTPTTNGVTIDYDGNVAHEVAVNGTDYVAQKLSNDTIRLTWLAAAANTKSRVL